MWGKEKLPSLSYMMKVVKSVLLTPTLLFIPKVKPLHSLPVHNFSILIFHSLCQNVLSKRVLRRRAKMAEE